MDHLKMHSQNKIDANISKIAALFPNCVTEAKDENGEIVHKIDFDMLKQELSSTLVEGREERYQFTWPDKKQAILTANAPINKTLRPCREESVNFDTTENLYIEGDNLEALKLLQETYLGKIKMIYIDPPYNTGNDFVYEDDFAQDAADYIANSGQTDEEGNRLVANTESNGRFHTDWLNMMYSRLKLARDVLSKDGVIAISISYNELYNLMKICSEMFNGHQVFAVTVQTSGGKPNGAFNISNEYIVFAVPQGFMPIPSEEDMKSYSSPYHGMNLATFNQIERPNQAYPIYVNNKGVIVGCGKSIQERIDEGSYNGFAGDFIYDYNEAPNDTVAVWPVTAKGEQCVWRLISSRLLSDWNKGFIKVVRQKDSNTKNLYSIQYLSGGIIEKIQNGELQTYRISDDDNIPTLEVKDYKTAGSGISSVWTNSDFYTTQGSNEIRELFSGKVFSYPKPLSLVSYILKRITTNNDIILDFFSGSATTAHAVMQLNSEDGGKRKFIMVQLPELTDEKSEAYKAGYKNICEIGKERIRRAGQQILKQVQNDKDSLFADEKKKLDIGFRVLKIDSTNMEDVYYTPDHIDTNDLFKNNIKSDRTGEDLLFQTMLDLGIMLSSKIETKKINGKEVFCVEDNYLMACFDDSVDEKTITEIAKEKPYYFVMRDPANSKDGDSLITNFEQIFITYSPDTVRKVL